MNNGLLILLLILYFRNTGAATLSAQAQLVSSQSNIAEDEAVKRLRAAAEGGDTTAQALLSYRLWEGRGVQKNRSESAKWLRDAASGGNPMAQLSLGSLLLRGDLEAGIAADVPQALESYRRAVEHADAEVTPQTTQPREAVGEVAEYREIRRGFERFHGMAAEQLGQLYENGRFVPRDDAEAVRWYRRGADGGYENAQWRLGLMFQDGRGVQQDKVEAEKWFIVANALREAKGSRAFATARDELGKTMSATDLSESQKRAQEWLEAFRATKRN